MAITSCTQYIPVFIPGTGNDISDHSHQWDTGNVLIAETCVDDGVMLYTCLICGEEKTEAINAHGHNFENDICTYCNNSKTNIDASEARIGLKYYKTLKEAVEAAIALDPAERVIDITAETIKEYNAHGIEINGSITINANGADFGNRDLAIYTYNNLWKNPESGEINIVINDAENLYLWGQPDDQLPNDNDIINVTMNNCHNKGNGSLANAGRMLYFTGTKGTTNITISNCSVESTDSPFYTNNPGKLEFIDCTFTNIAVPLNFNMKTAGTKTITVDGCKFNNCGATVDESADISKYSAPIRVVATEEGAKPELILKNSEFYGTKGDNGDVLLAVDGTYYGVNAVLEGNKTDVEICNVYNPKTYITINAGMTGSVSSSDSI